MSKGVRNALIGSAVVLGAMALFIRFFTPSSPPPFAEEIVYSEGEHRFPVLRSSAPSQSEARELEMQIRSLLADGKIDEARREFQKLRNLSGAVSPQQLHLLERALEEGVVLRRGESPYAVVSFDGVEGDELGDEALALVDDALADLATLFGAVPDEKVQVVVYSDPRFSSATGAPLPEWVEAGFDGKLRLPAELIFNTERRERVIRHEMSHAFTRMISGGAVPIWLDEGIAQFVEGRTPMPCWPPTWDFPSLEELRGSFVRESDPRQAHILYQSSLSALHHLVVLKGWSAVQSYLHALGEAENEEKMFRKFFESDHRQHWADVQVTLASQLCPVSEPEQPSPSLFDPFSDPSPSPEYSEEEERIDPRLSPEAEEYSLYPGEDRSGEHEEPEEPSEEIADSDDD